MELDQALHTALAQAAELLGLQTGWIWLLREETGESYLAAAQNLPPALARDPRCMEGTCYCLDTFRSGDLSGAANINVITCSRLRGVVDGTDGIRYHASIPLYAQTGRLGVMNLASTDWRELSEEDLRLLHTVGDLLSIAIERARLFARSAELGAAEERNLLARELHDTLAQGLAAVALQLETADALLEAEGDRDAVRSSVRHALTQTRANLDEARRSVLDLRAAPLEGKTLVGALQALTDQTVSTGSIRVDFEHTGGHPLPARLEVGLDRIAQEALHNVLRHAGARQAHLRLVTTPDQVTLTVEDDGQGFDPSRVSADRFGLIGLTERARLLGGTVRLQSSPGAGTRVEVAIPRRQGS